jgi:hypothetical protein
MERFTLKISGNKKISIEELFPNEEKGFHPTTENISDALDGISFDELLKEHDVLKTLNVKIIDTHLGFEWELSGFGWKLVNSN